MSLRLCESSSSTVVSNRTFSDVFGEGSTTFLSFRQHDSMTDFQEQISMIVFYSESFSQSRNADCEMNSLPTTLQYLHSYTNSAYSIWRFQYIQGGFTKLYAIISTSMV